MNPLRVALVLATCLGLAVAPAHAASLRRFAILVGNNRGGEGTHPLRYAEDDAQRLYDILVRLGGVLPEDAQLLLGREAGDLWSAWDRVERRAESARSGGEQTAVFLFFSGHARDGALRMGATPVPLDQLKARVGKSTIDVRVAVLDACRSGAITRSKGARLAPAFEVDEGTSPGAKGMVILTSSSSDEESQESDAIQGSFFSHYLASALLGSGDSSGDGRVTLSEAYAYAYSRTVAQTVGTASGVQHPTYDYQLSGSGDLVMTDVAARQEGLRIPAATPDGLYWIVDDQGAIAAEFDKHALVDERIALAPGAYVVTRRLPDHLRLGQVHVRAGELTLLDESALHDAPYSDDPVKGSEEIDLRARLGVRPMLGVETGYETWLGQPAGLFAPALVLGLRLDFAHAMSDHFGAGIGLALASTNGAELTIDGRALPFHYSELVGSGDVFYDFAPRSAWQPYIGGRIAWMLMTRTFQDPTLPKQFYTTFTPGLLAGLRREFGDHLLVSAELASQYLLYTLSTQPESIVYAELDVRLAWGW